MCSKYSCVLFPLFSCISSFLQFLAGGDTKERGFSSDSIEGGDPSSTANTVTTAAGAGGSVPAAPTSTSSPAPSSGAGANNSNSGNIGTAAPSSAAAAPAPGAPTAGTFIVEPLGWNFHCAAHGGYRWCRWCDKPLSSPHFSVLPRFFS